MTALSFAFSAEARCERPRLEVSSDERFHPGRFDVGPEEKQGLFGLMLGLFITGVVLAGCVRFKRCTLPEAVSLDQGINFMASMAIVHTSFSLSPVYCP